MKYSGIDLHSDNSLVTVIDEEDRVVAEKRLQERVVERAEYALLKSVPGIGQVLATVILLETGPIERFAAPGNFASYARCVNSVHTSNGKKKGEGNTRNGNEYLAWAFVEAANFALRYCPEAKRLATGSIIAVRLILMGVWRDSSQPHIEETGAVGHCNCSMQD